ncbi:zinc finger, RING/FYVE/PHD-type containing protein [Tanacetum coccineum]
MDEEDRRWSETEDDDEEDDDNDELEEDEAEEEQDDEDEDEVEEEFDEVEEEEFDEFEDEEKEEVDDLEEMTSQWVSSWMDEDGKTVHGIMVIDDDLKNPKNKCQFDNCSICYRACTSHGKHQLCSLQCGHMYGFSCIKKWLLRSSSSGKCPQCNTFSSYEDIILLYPPRVCVAGHQKASSGRRFPFTKQGYLQFKDYEMSRKIGAQKPQADARKLQADDVDRMTIAIEQQFDTVNLGKKLSIKWDTLLKCAEKLEEQAEEMKLADALRRRANPLKPWIDALGRGASALERRASTLKLRIDALGRRIDALGQRADAFESRVNFFCSMYAEHWIRLAQQKKSTEPCATIQKR